MTHKYERQCWNCGSKNMKKFTNHVKCQDCGATWNVVPDVHQTPVLSEVDVVRGETGKVETEKGKPSSQVARRAARARENL